MGGDVGAVSLSALPHALLAHDQGPLHLALVVTLVLIALLAYTLRVLTRSRLLRSFTLDDGLMLLAALCVVGVFITFTGLVELGLGQEGANITLSNSKSTRIGPWMWAHKSIHIFGLGLVKLSAAFTLFPVSNSRFHAYVYIFRGVLLVGYIFLVFWQTLEWFVSILAYCFPLVAAWDLSYGENVRCMAQGESKNWAIANHSINAGFSLFLVVFALPTVLGSSFKIRVQLFLTVVAAIALFSSTIAVVRSRMVVTSWAEIGDRGKYDLSFTTWGAVELLTAMIAVNLGTLLPLHEDVVISKSHPPSRSIPKISGPVPGSAVHVSHGDVNSLFNADAKTDSSSKSETSRYSGQTIMYRPNTAYFPAKYKNSNVTRFHDDESNLDFDIETPSTRSTRKVTKPPPTSRFSGSTTYTKETRRTSNWSQFSGFTYYSHTSSPDFGNVNGSEDRARVSMKELKEISRSLGIAIEADCDYNDHKQEIHVVSDKKVEEGRNGAFPAIFLEDDSKYGYMTWR